MRPIVVAGFLCGAVLPAAGADAGPDAVRDLLEKAGEKAREREVAAAAALYGDALALAQSRGDLPAEGEAAAAWSSFLHRTPPSRPATGRDGDATDRPAPGRAEAMAIVMDRLDAARNGTFVSAPMLASDLLLEATARGDGSFVKEAAAVLARHDRKALSGRCLMAMARYAHGMKALADGKPEAGEEALRDALGRFVEEGWADLAVHAGTELAARRAAAGDPAGAAAALEGAAVLFAKAPDLRLAFRWRDLVAARLKDAPAEALAPFHRATDPLLGDGGKGGPGQGGGAGGAGKAGTGAGSPRPVSPVGEALRRTPRGRPIVVVTLRDGRFDLRVPWDAGGEGKRPLDDAVAHWADGGLVLAFHGPSVAVMQVDPVGLDGAPGVSPDPEPGRAWYRLADGETWSFSKEGVVSMGR